MKPVTESHVLRHKKEDFPSQKRSRQELETTCPRLGAETEKSLGKNEKIGVSGRICLYVACYDFEVVVKEIDNEEPKEETIPEPIQEEAPKEEEKPEEIIEPPVQEKPQPAPKPKRVRPSRAKPPFDPEAFENDLVKQLKEELQSAMSARDTYNKAKEEKNKATREKLKSLASKVL